MFPLLIPMAAGALGGAALSKKPLKGALLGAGLGAGVGAAAPAIGGLLGGGSAAAAGGAATGAASSGAASAGFGLGQPLVTGAMGSSNIAGAAGGAGNMAGLLDTANKFTPLMGVGMQAMGQMGDEQPMQGAAPQINQGGSEVLASLANNGQGGQMPAEAQARAQRRNARRFS